MTNVVFKTIISMLVCVLMLISVLVSCGKSGELDTDTTNIETEADSERDHGNESSAETENDHTHEWSGWDIALDATCTTAGELLRSCSCGATEKAPIAALGHRYTSVITDPTCTVYGYTTYTCYCGHTYSDSYIDAPGHSYGSWVPANAATCTSNGAERRDCNNCDHYETKPIESTGHSYSHVVTPPTCTNRGYTTHTCTCGYSYVDAYVNATGHTYAHVVTPPSCTSQGYTTHTCTCGDFYIDSYTNKTEHDYDSVEISPTCTTQGYTTHTCYCGDSYVDSYVDPHDDSYDHNYICDDCGYLLPGLYDANGDMIASWRELVDVYGMNATSNYKSNTVATAQDSPYYVLTNTPALAGGVELSIGDINKIGSYAFSSLQGLTNVVITDSATSIGQCAFYQCSKLSSVTIGNGVKFIESYAFADCNNLTSVTIGDSVTSIGNSAFYECRNLTSVTIPNNVTTIGASAFMYCDDLTSVTIGESVNSISSSAFYDCRSLVEVYNLSSLNISSGSTYNGYVGYYALDIYKTASSASKLWSTDDGCVFYENYSVCFLIRYTGTESEIILPSSCNGQRYAIYPYAFYDCSEITSVIIPDNVTSIGAFAFECSYGISNLAHVTIGNGVQSIGDYAFRQCEKLTSISIGNSVESIGDSAFWGCYSLTSLVIPDSVTTIGSDAFQFCYALTRVTIGNGITTIGECFRDCYNIISVTIGKNVKSIDSYAFWDSDRIVEVYNLSSLTITAGQTGNGKVARYALDVYTSLATPSKLYVTRDGYIFYDNGTDCYLVGLEGGVTDVVLPEMFNGKIYSINPYAFSDNKSITSVTLPSHITSIDDYAFYKCTNLQSITIPHSVASIGNWAFYECGNLSMIAFDGKVAEWNQISIAVNWYARIATSYVVCDDGFVWLD